MMRNPRRPVLVGGLGLLGSGTGTFVASMLLASSPHPGWREAAGTLRALSPWLVLAGAMLTLLWVIVSRLARTPVTKRSESTLFRDTTQLGETRGGARRRRPRPPI